MPAPRKAALAFVFVTVVLDVVALGIVIPVLPGLVANLLHGDVQRAAIVYGVFVTLWEAMQFVFSPLLGVLSDRFGRRAVILASNVGLGLDYVLMALAPSLPWLLVGRLVSGLTSASYAAAGAYIADVTPPEKRAAGFGLMGAAFGLGFIIGPAIGGVLGAVNPRLPFWFAAACSLANAAYGFVVLPESLPREQRMPFAWRRANPVGSLMLLLRHRGLIGLAGAMFLMNLAHFVLQSTFVLYANHRYAWGAREVGLMLAGLGVGAAIVQGGLVRRMTPRLGERRTMLLGTLFGALGFAIYGAAPTSAMFVAGLPAMALWGLGSPPSQSIMSRAVGPSEQGQLQGAFTSMTAVAGMFGPSLFTRTFAWAIAPGSHGRPTGAPFYVSAALLLAATVIAALATRASRSSAEDDRSLPRAVGATDG